MNSASALESSVLPTPEGPRNRNDPIGRCGSFRPDRARRIVLLIALIASSCDTTRLCSSFSSSSSRWASSFSRRVSGTPVILLTTSAMTSSSTTPSTSLALLAPLPLHLFFLGAQRLGLIAQLGGFLVLGVLAPPRPSGCSAVRSALRVPPDSAAWSCCGGECARRPRPARRSPCPAGTGR